MSNQQELFPAVVACGSCGWTWREQEAPPPEHVRRCLQPAQDDGAPALGRGSVVANPPPNPGVEKRPVPLKKWRCVKCWSRFPRPRQERAPLCRDCREGQPLLFGERSLLRPDEADPLVPGRKRKR